MKRALIIGVSGQDGAYLAQLLLSKGYEVFGSSRDARKNGFANLKTLNIFQQVNLLSVDTTSIGSIKDAIERSQADEIYNLSGQSSVGLSFEQPQETMISIVDTTSNILDSIKAIKPKARFFNAGSGECFGDTREGGPANELTPFNPQSPYAQAKAQAFELVKDAREKEGLYACTGILFNHESPLRPNHFVTQKIIQGAQSIAQDLKANKPIEKLRLGNLAISRDWGWAPEYVEAMWIMLQQTNAEDFVIATGVTNTLERFVDMAFAKANLDWHDHVVIDQALFRPNEALEIAAQTSRVNEILDWHAKLGLEAVVDNLFACHLSSKF